MTSGNSQSFARNIAKHPLTNIFGISKEGWLAVTETGKVCIINEVVYL
jgi:hypothetical protein